MPGGREGGEVLYCWAEPAAKNGLVLKCVKVTFLAGTNVISISVKKLQCLTFITEFGLICNQQRKILFYMQLPSTDN